MNKPTDFPIEKGWQLMLQELGMAPVDVLRRASLPEDLVLQDRFSLSKDEHTRLWVGVEAEAKDPLLPMRLIESFSPELFSPPVFAALCSKHLVAAAERMSLYKRLMAPVKLHVQKSENELKLTFDWLDKTFQPVASFVAMELFFFIKITRLATRERVNPLAITMVQLPQQHEQLEDYCGVPLKSGSHDSIVFSMKDATLPFLTVDHAMWEIFEPALKQRLSTLQNSATTTERVRAVLLEALPGGTCSIEQVARKLAVGKRTLQRRLSQEKTSFQTLLNQTREELARYYLTSTDLTHMEISFLLGFGEPSSFFRAFQSWTGMTPEEVRSL